MIFYRVLFVVCILVLLRTKAAIRAAATAGDLRRVRVLQLFRLGFGLSAFSYLLHIITVPPNALLSLGSLISCFLGTLCICVGWMEHGQLFQERPQAPPDRSVRMRDAPEGTQADDAGLPLLDGAARRVLQIARAEAQYGRQSCMDTDHLLLGLLREPSHAAGDILRRLGIEREKIFLTLGQYVTVGASVPRREISEQPLTREALTERARQMLTLSAQEAHRFDRPAVGTEHLLLGLVLMGTGAAASVLFQNGVTVENVRDEILKKRAA